MLLNTLKGFSATPRNLAQFSLPALRFSLPGVAKSLVETFYLLIAGYLPYIYIRIYFWENLFLLE